MLSEIKHVTGKWLFLWTNHLNCCYIYVYLFTICSEQQDLMNSLHVHALCLIIVLFIVDW